MSTYWTADGYSGGWPSAWTADGWPTDAIPWTADGFITPFTGGGGSGGGSGGSGGQGHGGGGGRHHHGHHGGGFHRKKRKRVYTSKTFDQILGDVGDIYEQLTNPRASEADREAAGAIVRAHAQSEAAVPQQASINWDTLEQDAKTVGRLLALWNKRMIEQDDEDFYILGE